jgi:YD repeat-containing protein
MPLEASVGKLVAVAIGVVLFACKSEDKTVDQKIDPLCIERNLQAQNDSDLACLPSLAGSRPSLELLGDDPDLWVHDLEFPGAELVVTYGESDNLTASRTYTYDSNGSISLVTHRLPDQLVQWKRTYSYDSNGRLELVTQDVGGSWEQTYSYDSEGHLDSVVTDDLEGHVTTRTYGYDSEGRLDSVTTSDGEGHVLTRTYGYDSEGRLDNVAESDGEGNVWTWTYSYDSSGRPSTVTFEIAGAGVEWTRSLFYDNGRPGGVTHATPEGGVLWELISSYDADGLLEGVTGDSSCALSISYTDGAMTHASLTADGATRWSIQQ